MDIVLVVIVLIIPILTATALATSQDLSLFLILLLEIVNDQISAEIKHHHSIIFSPLFGTLDGHVIDFIVVFASIIFEFTLHHAVGAAAIFFRTWRFCGWLH